MAKGRRNASPADPMPAKNLNRKIGDMTVGEFVKLFFPGPDDVGQSKTPLPHIVDWNHIFHVPWHNPGPVMQSLVYSAYLAGLMEGKRSQ